MPELFAGIMTRFDEPSGSDLRCSREGRHPANYPEHALPDGILPDTSMLEPIRAYAVGGTMLETWQASMDVPEHEYYIKRFMSGEDDG